MMGLEFRSDVDDAWYDARTVMDGYDRLRIKFIGFPDDHDEVYDAMKLSSFNDIDEFRRRFRPVSVQVQDSECSQVVKGMLVCAAHSVCSDDRRFYDAVVNKDIGTSRRPSSLSSPFKDMIGNHFQRAGHDLDMEGGPHMIIIDNLEKGLSPLKIVEFIHRQVSISCQAFVSPSMSTEWYTRGIILLDSKKNVDKLFDFLESPNHIIVSSSGRPWVMTEKAQVRETLWASIENFMFISQKILQSRRTGTSNELKVVITGTEEYRKAKLLKDLFWEFANHQCQLHRRLLIEEGKIWQLSDAT